ncbi:MAG: T9SS type A sorting domain-containing protein, partial [Cyclobacteriaceae bacterium]|nr:T9SS type A sorting domain-containing protein [Cyclobacteriaceae bacterium]
IDVGGVATGNGDGSITSGSFNSFSNITLANLIGGTNPLPVELVSFTGHYNGQEVALKWKTASELNNDYFSVQRSSSGLDFYEISQINGNGTTNTSSEYHWIDSNPNSGKNYYRLQQVDFDGKSNFSGVVLVDVTGSDTKSFLAFPNPGKSDEITIQVTGLSHNSTVVVEILSIAGQSLWSLEGQTNSTGSAWLSMEEVKLPQGLYLLRIRGTQMITKVVIN